MEENGGPLVVLGVVLIGMGLIIRAVPDRLGPTLTGPSKVIYRLGRWGWTVGIPAAGLFCIVQGILWAVS